MPPRQTVPMDSVAQGDVTVSRGPDNPTDAAICVIVIAVDGDPAVGSAIGSIIGQSVAAEIVVVNSGAGSLAATLPAQLLRRITLVESAARRFPGGTRNLGVAHSAAPIVAFLAADCAASPDWLHARLLAHNDGQELVASSVRPAVDRRGAISSAAWASYVLVHAHRAPCARTGPDPVLFGLSYARPILERHGPFDETVRVSEDLQFNRMLRDRGYRAHWDRQIVTVHTYPGGLASAMLDQFGRGRRSAQYARDRGQSGLLAHLRLSWRRNRRRIAAARLPRDDFDFGHPRAVLRMLYLLSFAQGLGALSAIIGPRSAETASSGR